MERVEVAAGLMTAFGERTGVTTGAAPRRYLWTDAFAVCNYLALHRHTGDPAWLEQARTLIQQVHHVLGRHRPDNARTGWISGLSDAEGEEHPTAGGLRIGKPLPERRPSEPADDRVDWDRDGQYHHYLTRWEHALDRAATALGDPELRRLGVELAAATHAAFAHGRPGERRLYWKMSVDLSHPVVATMGQHDALDGLIAAAFLAAHAGSESGAQAALQPVLRDLAAVCRGRGWATHDALGLGLLITDVLFLADPLLAALVPATLFERALRDAVRSLELVTVGPYLEGPAEDRLAFRELGLAIGLAAASRLDEQCQATGLPGGDDTRAALPPLLRHAPLRESVESFWLNPRHQAVDSWLEHQDINAVMLATSLLPDGYLA